MQSGESELADRWSEEWLRAWALALDGTVETILLTLLTKSACDSRDDRSRICALSGSCILLYITESAEDDVCEGVCQGDGAIEIVYRKIVFARLDDGSIELLKDIVGIKGMEFLLLRGCQNDAIS